MTHDDDALVGRTLGGFEIRALLARGGTGSVYEAEQLTLERRIALKIPSSLTLSNAERSRRFFHEAKLLAKLQHPNVVQIYKVGEERGIHYLAMEFVEGTNLQEKLDRRRQVSENEALAIAIGVLRALAAAHELGIVHRDVKPGNVLLTNEGVVKLADFGFAKDFAQPRFQTAEGMIVGTPLYMSPEQAGGGAIDRRTDIYSLGATLYHVLSGRPALADRDLAIRLPLSPEGPPPLREIAPGVAPDLAAWIDRAVARDPEARYDTAAEALEVMEGIARDRRARARTLMSEPPWWRTRWAAVAGLAALLVATSLALVALARSAAEEEPATPEPEVEAPGPAPEPPAVADARSELEEARRLATPSERRQAFLSVVERHPGDERACAEALLGAAKADEEAGEIERARRTYFRILRDYPDETDLCRRARERIGALNRRR